MKEKMSNVLKNKNFLKNAGAQPRKEQETDSQNNSETSQSNAANISSAESLFGKVKGIKLTMSTLPFIGIAAGVFLFAAVFVTLLGAEISATEPSTIIEDCQQVEVINTENNIYDRLVDLETYVAGAVAAMEYNTDNIEFYKVIAIQKRSEMMKKMENNCRVNEKNNSNPYIPVENSEYANEINSAINSTKNMVLTEGDTIYFGEIKIDETEALRLITEENYTYEKVINKYVEKGITIKNASK